MCISLYSRPGRFQSRRQDLYISKVPNRFTKKRTPSSVRSCRHVFHLLLFIIIITSFRSKMRNSAICVLPGCDKLRRTEAVDVVVVHIANGCRARRLIPFRNRHSVVKVERLTFAIVCLNRIKLLVKILFPPLSLLRKLVLFIAQSLVDVASTD